MRHADAVALLTLNPGTTIGGARDLRPIVEDALRGIVLEPSRLLQVKDSLIAARNLKRVFQKDQGEFPNSGEYFRAAAGFAGTGEFDIKGGLRPG